MAKAPLMGEIPNLKNTLVSRKMLGTNTAHLGKSTATPLTTKDVGQQDHSFFPTTEGGPAKMPC